MEVRYWSTGGKNNFQKNYVEIFPIMVINIYITSQKSFSKHWLTDIITNQCVFGKKIKLQGYYRDTCVVIFCVKL